MNISEEEVRGLDPAALAARLRERGADLAGRNLARASWLDIARALRRRVPGNQLLIRLRAADTRADVLRILRVARTFERDAQRAGRPLGRRNGGTPTEKTRDCWNATRLARTNIPRNNSRFGAPMAYGY